jgi:hypothetical protein
MYKPKSISGTREMFQALYNFAQLTQGYRLQAACTKKYLLAKDGYKIYYVIVTACGRCFRMKFHYNRPRDFNVFVERDIVM